MSSRLRNALTTGAIVALLGVVLAGLMSGPATQQDRAAALERQLRCPVCKSVSIAESPSETAASMRRIVAEQVAAGRSDAEIIDHFQDRYGPWVLLDPPMSGLTIWLWLLAIGGAAGGAAVLLVRLSRRATPSSSLPDDERERVSAALAEYRSTHDLDDEP